MRLRVLVAVLLLALPAGGLAAVHEGVVLHLLNGTVPIAPDKLPPHNVKTKTYTVRGEKGSHTVTHPGISLAALFNSVGANAAEYKFIQIRRPDLSYAYVTPDSDAIVWLKDGAMHFLRPLNGKEGDKNAADNFKIEPGKPLVIAGHTGNILVVTLSASSTQANTGQELAFSATVTGQKTNEKLTYTWRFGDGQSDDGQSVKHTYDSQGRYNVFVTVTGSDDSAGSSDAVQIKVGNPPPAAGTTGGSGTTGGGNPTTQSPPPVLNNTPQTPPAPLTSIPKNEGVPGAIKVSGILLAASHPVAAGSLLSPGSRPLVKTSSTPNLELPLIGAAAVLLLGLGAFFEGGGRIRIPKLKLWPR
jgi:PKD domain